ncbi:DNA mismatch repair protein MutS [Chitinivibrio alkaliphilus]|uniref:DNA mismatch repair protein MutS n=1 Tax=Chitinivibrio alkaliphilus ACht1 TaxID=1313304 RepID=U7DAZ7_9BACT|nr:DNA mismatch repair protein MutS [Chitinivibrio alkaliphilus]ERP39202.1 DNA mismatch repair protein MutS [Chitinivibrio alkaliphilus ACht1]
MKKETPMMAQYNKIKRENPGVMLLFRLGDFYEMFGDDAKDAARILGITLTKRNHGGTTDTPLAGFPHHALDRYAHKLVKAGKRIAVCEQMEDPKKAKGVVKRDVVEIVTPGTGMDQTYVADRENTYIVSLYFHTKGFACAICDISTGEFQCQDGEFSLLEECLMRVDPAEILIPQGMADSAHEKRLTEWFPKATLSFAETGRYRVDRSQRVMQEHFSLSSLHGLGFEGRDELLIASAVLLEYLRDMKRNPLQHISKIEFMGDSRYAQLDPASIRNLEIIHPLLGGQEGGTLLSVLDKTVTVLGARLLKKWLVRPLRIPREIEERLDAVEWFKDTLMVTTKIRELLRRVYDLERCITRIVLGRASARDIVALRISLEQFPQLCDALQDVPCGEIQKCTSLLSGFEQLCEYISTTLVDDPPVSLREGGLIRAGVDSVLDEYRDISHNGKDWIARLQQEEKEKTGIDSLKVGFNKVFGYYLEVSKVNIAKVPDYFIRKQTLANSERYITPELKEVEEKVLTAEEKRGDLEYALFTELREYIATRCEAIQGAAQGIARLDLFSTLGHLAMENQYIRPSIRETGDLHILGGRHPVVEEMTDAAFVPNDTHFIEDTSQFFVITGPNMAGKSTYLRQNALIALMAQVGSFVPAQKAEVGLVDKFFTRIGASDKLARGQSTFMVEMIEVANILHNATDQSLVLLDEVGRGTSTFDGISIAWAVAEYLHNTPGRRPRTLFATHYHELTELAMLLTRVENYHIAVRKHEGKILFLRKIEKGSSSHSYGIEVASIAGIPAAVTDRAQEIMQNLESMEFDSYHRPRLAQETETVPSAAEDRAEMQLDFLQGVGEEHPLLEKIRQIDVSRLTPLDALNTLAEMQNML